MWRSLPHNTFTKCMIVKILCVPARDGSQRYLCANSSRDNHKPNCQFELNNYHFFFSLSLKRSLHKKKASTWFNLLPLTTSSSSRLPALPLRPNFSSKRSKRLSRRHAGPLCATSASRPLPVVLPRQPLCFLRRSFTHSFFFPLFFFSSFFFSFLSFFFFLLSSH